MVFDGFLEYPPSLSLIVQRGCIGVKSCAAIVYATTCAVLVVRNYMPTR